jgi:hypothetical protein
MRQRQKRRLGAGFRLLVLALVFSPLCGQDQTGLPVLLSSRFLQNKSFLFCFVRNQAKLSRKPVYGVAPGALAKPGAAGGIDGKLLAAPDFAGPVFRSFYPC